MFTERTQSYLAAKYYGYLKEFFDDRGVKAFIHATEYYAGQRGRRMAQRAIRDGKSLTYETYSQYGEWKNTQEMIDEDHANEFEFVSTAPDTKMNIRKCPWRTQFKSMGAEEAGIVYCTYLDKAIVRGFNPDINYNVNLDGLDGCDGEYCTHTVSDFDAKSADMTKNEDSLMGFDYHCAHLYWSFREVAIAIFGYDGNVVANKVLEDLSNDFGKDYADTIMKYENTNFNVTF